nr:MAG: ORF1 [TTV-like mini virus]
MPWIYRRPYNNWRRRTFYRRRQTRYRRQRRHRFLRPRNTFRRRHRIRRVRRIFKRKKLRTITVKEWQPQTIKKCKIKGIMCLFQCGPGRESFNYAQYMNSLTPELWPGGGGWSIMIYNLGALFEQRQLIHNWWTASNDTLPLVRYNGCKFKFYRSANTDYIVHYRICYPMTDTEQEHLMAQPSLASLLRKKILVPSMKTSRKTRPYIVKRIRPPSQLKNSWYFQRDLCNAGLLLLTASAASFQHWFLNPKAVSDSITLYTLNTKNFNSRNFQLQGTQTWYEPRRDKYYQYTFGNGHTNPNALQKKDMIYLGNTLDIQPGIQNADTLNEFLSRKFMGSPFWLEYNNGDKVVWISNKPPKTLYEQFETLKSTSLTIRTIPTFIPCRYTPSRDTGNSNMAYFLSNARQEEGWDPPQDPNLIITGYPLWVMLWGLIDWQKKLKLIQQPDYNYILVIRSDCFDEKQPAYVFMDHAFRQNTNPYYRGDEPHHPGSLSDSNQQHFYPKIIYQNESINEICKTGPGVVRMNSESIEAKCQYTFYLKFGGCPAKMENIKDPCQQPKYNIPSNISQGLSIQDPGTDPTKFLYSWDERYGLLTKTAQKRLQKDSDTEKSSSLLTDQTRLNPDAYSTEKLQEFLQETQTTSTSEEEETSIQDHLQQQRQQHKQLKHNIKQLLKRLKTLE